MPQKTISDIYLYDEYKFSSVWSRNYSKVSEKKNHSLYLWGLSKDQNSRKKKLNSEKIRYKKDIFKLCLKT